jgi:predicted transcriptional regulator
VRRDESIPALGSLEARIMRVLWERPGEYLSVRETLDQLSSDLAYNTVMTVMHRLHDKGLLRRRRAGRAHTYRAAVSREAYVAEAMAEALRAAGDRQAALLHFVADLQPDDATALRRLLGRDEQV